MRIKRYNSIISVSLSRRAFFKKARHIFERRWRVPLSRQSISAALGAANSTNKKIMGGNHCRPSQLSQRKNCRTHTMRSHAVTTLLVMLTPLAAAPRPSEHRGAAPRDIPRFEGRSVQRDFCLQVRSACPPSVELSDENRQYCERFMLICR
jgi:hypothetical protein